jgi:hypothetical protein
MTLPKNAQVNVLRSQAAAVEKKKVYIMPTYNDDDLEMIIFDDVRARLVGDTPLFSEESLERLLALEPELGKDARYTEFLEQLGDLIELASNKKIVPKDPTLLDSGIIAWYLATEFLPLALNYTGVDGTRKVLKVLRSAAKHDPRSDEYRKEWEVVKEILGVKL